MGELKYRLEGIVHTKSELMEDFEGPLDVIFLYILLPTFGMKGYFASFLTTHLLNFILSLRRLMKIGNISIPFYIPVCSAIAAVAASVGVAGIHSSVGQTIGYLSLFVSLLTLMQIISKEDLLWIYGLIKAKK